jgi:hypothetical protein
MRVMIPEHSSRVHRHMTATRHQPGRGFRQSKRYIGAGVFLTHGLARPISADVIATEEREL